MTRFAFLPANRSPLVAGALLAVAFISSEVRGQSAPRTCIGNDACASQPVGVNAQPGQPPAVPSRDSVSLSLDEALARALGESEEIRLARATVEAADAQVTSTRAQALPQLNSSLAYTRTFYSPFQTGGFTLPDSLKFSPDSMASVLDRLNYLEKHAPTAALAGMGGLFGSLPLGRTNAYTAGLTASQILYSGGRTGAALRIAADYKRAAQSDFIEQVSEIALQVRQAYIRAALASQLEEIASAALDQAIAFQKQQQLRLDAGSASELDVLRAEVAAENLRPQLVSARNAAEVAVLDLKRLVDIPLTQPLRLTTVLAPPSAAQLNRMAEPEPALVAEQRAAVAAAERQVAIREQQIAIARGAFLPQVDFRMNVGAQNLPTTVFGFDSNPWRKDVSASIAVSLPIFTGFRRVADVQTARIALDQAKLQLDQLREAIQLQYQQARGERERALSTIEARQRTVDQAQRVHDLTVLRYDRGLATQLEVSDARLALLQARTNVAQAIADFYIADAGVERALGRAPQTGSRGN